MPNPAALRALVSGADEAGDAVRRVIRAYHGSPYDFDRFDASKIGTGEGAQAYGHGLYFAGAEDVARTYRDKLAQRTLTNSDGTVQPAPWFLPQEAIEDLSRLDDWRLEWAKRIRQAEERGLPSEYVRKELAAMDAIAAGAKVKSDGRMYEVEIGYPEEALLDWDKPVGGAIASRLDSRMAGDLAAEAQRMADMGQLPRHMQALNRIASGEVGLAPGEMVYRAAGRFDPPASRPGWSSVTATINDSVTNQARAAERLLDAGIPGIRYLDQGSRSAGEGTRNYVMFPGTEDRIRILRKYGLLAPMGAGMMGGDE